MSGKATIFVIAGFSLLFLVIAKNFGDVSNRAVDNFIELPQRDCAHGIAISGANIAANEIFLDPTWNSGFSNIPFQGGDLDSVFKAFLTHIKIFAKLQPKETTTVNTSTVKVKFAPSKFSKFAYYSVSEGGTIWWTGNDTVWGPFHTQDYMRAYRHPVFYGKATTKKIINLLY